jgi:hypothetical protein
MIYHHRRQIASRIGSSKHEGHEVTDNFIYHFFAEFIIGADFFAGS